MTERACLHCGIMFEPRHSGHLFHSSKCRHKGELDPAQRQAASSDAVDRLFAADRDPTERVREDDWHPSPGTPFHRLDAVDTVQVRRRWFTRLGEIRRPR
jgi:hypothetical protein